MRDGRKDIRRQIERIKRELELFLDLAEKLRLSSEDREKQINLYLDDLANLLDSLNQSE